MSRLLHKNVLKRLALAGLFAVFAACSPDDTSISGVDQFTITGTLSIPNSAPKGANVKLNAISRSGLRFSNDSFSIDSSGKFKFTLKNQFVHPQIASTAPEKIAAMGAEIPAASQNDGVTSVREGFARLEFLLGDLPSEPSRKFYYLQAIVPIPHAVSLRKNRELSLDGGDAPTLALTLSGKRSVIVVNREGNPIEGASVSVIPYKEQSPAPSWVLPSHSAVASVTGSDGIGQAWPIALSTNESYYQVAIQAEKYCLAVTPPMIFVEEEASPLKITLDPCDGESSQSFDFSFLDEIQTLEEDAANGKKVAYVNAEKITIRAKALKNIARGIEMFVYKGFNAEGDIVAKGSFPAFANELSLNLPINFGSGLANASQAFSVRIRVLNAPDPNEAETILLGRFNNSIPAFDPSKVEIESVYGTKDLISGQADGKFVVKNAPCPTGGALTFAIGQFAKIDESTAAFVPCAQLPFTVNTSQVAKTSSKNGGLEVLQMIYRDAFGNLSSTTATTTQKKVYVDYGSANLESQEITSGVDVGVIARASPNENGTNDAPLRFETPLEIKPATVANFKFAFAAPNACRHLSPSKEDGPGDGSLGNLIAGYLISSSDENTAPEAVTNYTACTNHLPLSASLIHFPTDRAENAYMFLRVIDQAGNQSNFKRIEFKPCVLNAPKVPPCWSP